MRPSLRLALAACLALLLLPAASSAQSKAAQGSTLAAAPGYPFNCEVRWTFGGPPSYQAVPNYIGPSTCGIYQAGTTVDDTGLVPGPGKVTSARVRAGADPAPLSITVLRRYTGVDVSNPSATQDTCCLARAESAVFTPTPNAVTEVPLDFTVETKLFDPNTKQTGYHDIIGINVQGPGSLPIAEVGDHSALAPASVQSIRMGFPAIKPGQNVEYGWFANGWELLMNYSWCASTATRQACGKAVTPTGPTPPVVPTNPTDPKTPTEDPKVAASKLVSVSSRRLVLKGRSVPVKVACAKGAAACKGTVRLRTKGKKPDVLGRRGLKIAAGRSATIKVPLSARNRRRIGRKGLSVSVQVDLGGGKVVSRGVILRRR